MKKGVGSGVGSGSPADPDPLVRGTDMGIQIRIRNKMSRIPNTLFQKKILCGFLIFRQGIEAI